MRNIIFYLVLIIAAIGLVMNLDAFIFSIVRMLVSFAVIAGIIYLIYYFFILTEDQRKYRKAMRKYKKEIKEENRQKMEALVVKIVYVLPFFILNYFLNIHSSERYFSVNSSTSAN